MAALKIGDDAPDFELRSQTNEAIRLSDFVGKKNVVLYFYPKDFTQGCTTEAKAFRESYEEFRSSNTEVIGVSADSVETHERFSQRCGLQFSLLSDSGKRVRDLYGANTILGISGRMTFVIDMQGKIRYILSSMFQPARHVKEALRVLRAEPDPRPAST